MLDSKDWREEWLGEPVEDALAHGSSVAVVPNFASPAECSSLIDAAEALVQDPPPQLTGDDPTLCAGRLRLPAIEWNHAPAQALSKTLVWRALTFVRQHFPSLAEHIGPAQAAITTNDHNTFNIFFI